MIKVLNVENFIRTHELIPVTESKIFNKNSINQNSLFSESIFGPIKNFTCKCGVFHGVGAEGKTCPECKIKILHSKERRKRFSYIELPIKVMNPIFLEIILSVGGQQIKKYIDMFKKSHSYILYTDDNGNFQIDDSSEEGYVLPTDRTYTRSIDAILEFCKGITDDNVQNPKDKNYKKWKLIHDNIDDCFLSNKVLVLPPEYRPQSNQKDVKILDKINMYYRQILIQKEIRESTTVTLSQDPKLQHTSFITFQKIVDELYDFIFNTLSNKEVLIRGNILGKRIDFSGRAVIAPDPYLNLDECQIPYRIILELFKIQIAKKLVEAGKKLFINEAISYIDECKKFKNLELMDYAVQVTDGKVVILNRQPSLHRLSVLAFRIIVNTGDTIKIHPMVCSPYNADFDGDQMAIYLPITENAQLEAKEKLYPSKNLINASNGRFAMRPQQDIVFGIYTLTSDNFPELREVVNYKGQDIPNHVKMFNECLPEDFRLVTDMPIDDKKLGNILSEIAESYPGEISSETIDNVKRLGFKYVTLYGTTMSLDGCHLPNVREIQDRIFNNNDSIQEQLKNISSQETTDILRDSFQYSVMIDSGARGSWDQARQIILARGYISNFSGNVMPTPIVNSLVTGLTQKEFFTSTYGCRKGLMDIAINTGASGYLSRKLIFTATNMILGSEDDCGTSHYLNVYVKDLQKSEMIVGKYMLLPDGTLGEITRENAKELVGKTIQVRSPIYCLKEKICTKCYGNYNHNTRFIGVIAAQALGETNTQLVLRTFHSSGVATFKETDPKKDEENNDIIEDPDNEMQNQDVINDLSTAARILHKFNDSSNPNQLVSDLYDVYNTSKKIYHAHFECIIAQLMWTSENLKWRLHPQRDTTPVIYYSVQSVPDHESWLLSLGFSNPRKSVLKGLFEFGNYNGIIDHLLTGQIHNII